MDGRSSRKAYFNRWAWRLLAAQWIVLLAVFTAYRLAFYWRYHPLFAGAGAFELLRAFIVGARYDLAVIFVLTGLPGVVLLLASPWRWRGWVVWPLFWLQAAVALGMFVLEGVDLFYYGFVGRHISFEAYVMANDWHAVVAMIARGYAFTAIGVLLAIAAGIALAVAGYRRLARRPFRPVRAWSNLAQATVLLLGTAVIVRGTGLKPLSFGLAFDGPNVPMGHLALNGVFTTVVALADRSAHALRYYPDAEAEHITRKLLGLDGPPLERQYPLLHRFEAGSGPPRLRNVVILVIESFSAQLTGVLGGRTDLTPHFNALAHQGLLFSNFYATGTRSVEGISTIVTGYPALPNALLIGSPLAQNTVRSLPMILKAHGYHTLFLHGAPRNSMYFGQFARRTGFDRHVSLENFPNASTEFDGDWGIYDHYALERLNAELTASPKPVMALFFSLTSHTPYSVPKDWPHKFGPDTPNAAMLNAYAYTDWSLGRFFDMARREPYWRNTIFLITADHNKGDVHLNARERQWIPLLILSPGDPDFPRGQVRTTLGSQLDIAPTVLDLLHISALTNFAGQSLLRPAAHRFALFSWGNQAGWLDGRDFIVHDMQRPLAMYRWRQDPGLKHNLLPLPGGAGTDGSRPEAASLQDFQAYLETLNNLLMYNRVFPYALIGENGSAAPRQPPAQARGQTAHPPGTPGKAADGLRR